MKTTAFALVTLLLLPTSVLASDRWERITIEDGVTVYSKDVEGSDLVAFKGVTTIKQPLAKVLSVLMDHERATEWADRLQVSKVLEAPSKFEYVLYQHVGLPFLVSDRDFVSSGRAYRDEKGNVVLTMNATTHPEAPTTVGVRAQLVRSQCTLIPKGKNQTTVVVEIHADPKGLLPACIVNQIQKSWPVNTLNGVRRQASRKDVQPYPLPPKREKPVSTK